MDDKSRICEVRVTTVGMNYPGDIADSITYIVEDQIGSSVARLKSTSATNPVIDKEEYYPFGDSSLRTFTMKRYRYVGKEKDAESGLYYYGARYYAAWTCRFISVDPLAADYNQFSPYLNAGNNPINSFDVNGEEGSNSSEGGDGGGSTGSDGGGAEASPGTPDSVESDVGEPATGGSAPEGSSVSIETPVHSSEPVSTSVAIPDAQRHQMEDFTSSQDAFTIQNPAGGINKIGGVSKSNLTYNDSGQVTVMRHNNGSVYAWDPGLGFYNDISNLTNPATIGNNFFGSTYIGGNNPKTFMGEDSYYHIPKSPAEYPAIGHDQRYDYLGINGPGGVFTKTEAIGADLQFIFEQRTIANIPVLPLKDRFMAAASGEAIAFSIQFKIGYLFLTNPSPKEYINKMYKYSNEGGASNIPKKQDQFQIMPLPKK